MASELNCWRGENLYLNEDIQQNPSEADFRLQRYRIEGLDQIDEILPGHHSLHLGQKSLPLGAFPRGGLLVITESELLAAHEPSYSLASQRHCGVDPVGYPELP